MAASRKVKLAKRFSHVLCQLFADFPNLQWFRNIHDRLVHIDWTSEYLASAATLSGTSYLYYLTSELNGPILYYGRDLDGRPWAFASNAMKSSDPSVSWLVSVEKPDHFMVAVLNTLLHQEGLMPKAESELFCHSMGLSNCEEPGKDVVEWLKAHEDQMPEQLAESCDRAHLYRM